MSGWSIRMPAETTMTIRLAPNTEDLCRVLEIIGKHAAACAAELRETALAAPSMDYDAAKIAEDVAGHIEAAARDGRR
jgi:hypothetical protein